MQTEMDPIVREVGAQSFHYGSGSTYGSLAFIRHLHVRSTTLLDSLHTEVDVEPKTFGSGCSSFAFVDNVGDVQWTQVHTLDKEVQDPPPSPIPPSTLL